MTFEQLGCDRIFIDEAHYFKNLFLFTKMRNVGGIAQTEAQKSSDLFMKCQYLDEITEGRGIVFATGTPISNSMVEMYTMQRYLQYSTLAKANLLQFDSWASTFGETVTAMELSPEGTGYRSKTRFAKFYNLPELMSMFKEVADIQTAETLKLPVPKANRKTIAVKPSNIQKEMVKGLGERAEKIRKDKINPKIDNMLKITNEGRKLALDQRLLNPMLPDFEGSKVNACVNNVYDIWEKSKDKKSTQLVFCDLSTPKNLGIGENPYEKENINGVWKLKEWQFTDVYTDLKRKLIEKGIPENEIAFIHSADTEVKKKELFAKVRKGEIRILMGSTSKMGAGTNVQKKIKAIHHLDVPYRPSDLQQQDGRGIRQGNENEEIDIYNYVTEGTFDAYMYQMLQRKQEFISQIMTSKAIVRSADDIDEKALSYAEIKALAAGNPLIVRKTELDNKVAKLKLLKQNHLNQIYALEDMIVKNYPIEIKRLQDKILNIQSDIKIVEENTNIDNEEKFSTMILNEKQYNSKETAGKAILEICKEKKDMMPELIGEYRGLKMLLGIDRTINTYILFLQGKERYEIELGTDIRGNITRIENCIVGFGKELEDTKAMLEETQRQLDNAKEAVKAPFNKEEELKQLSKELEEINLSLNLDEKDKEILDDEEQEEKEDSERKSQDLDKDRNR